MTEAGSDDSLRSWAKQRFWVNGRWVVALLELAGVVGACLTGWDGFFRVASIDQAHPGLLSYLWATFVVSTLGVALLLVTYRSVRVDLADTRRDAEELAKRTEATRLETEKISALGNRLLHRMAELVRRRVDSSEFNWSLLEAILGSGGLADFTRRAIGQPSLVFRVTVKRFEKNPSGDKIVKVFRSAGDQDRAARDSLSPDDSLIWTTFRSKDEHIGQQKQVVIPDVQRIDESRLTYKKSAEECGFRSIIAFPLRAPSQELTGMKAKANQLLGFMSIDCRDVDVFAKLFNNLDGWVESPPTDPSILDVFHGIADGVATILMLEGGAGHGKNSNLEGA